MSLQTVAKHMASQGRGPDTQLVHMTQNEVARLQELARKNGGSLTINPTTGLPEAGFLDDIFDGVGDIIQDITSSPVGSMLAGAALMAAGIPPSFAGLATGVASLASGNSLGQSFGAGLGAYGGASMAGSMGVGAPTELAPVADANPAVLPGGTVSAPTTAPISAPVPETLIPKDAFPTVGATASDMSARQIMNSPAGYGDYMPSASTYDAGLAAAPQAAAPQIAAKAAAPTTSGGIMDTLSGYYDKAGKWVAENPGLALAGAAGLGALAGAGKPDAAPEKDPYEGAYIRPFVYNPKTGGLQQLRVVKAPVKAARGGLMPSNNTQYPMADITHAVYATPYQTPYAENMLGGAQDVAVDPYSGQEKPYASGGLTFGGITNQDAYEFLSGAAMPTYGERPAPAVQNSTQYAAWAPRDPTAVDDTGNTLNNLKPYDSSSSVSPAATALSRPGQGVNNFTQSLGLGLMKAGQIAPALTGLTGLAANFIGGEMVDSQLDAMGQANAAAGVQNTPGVVSVSDQSGNVISRSSPASIAAADAAMFGGDSSGSNSVSDSQGNISSSADYTNGADMSSDSYSSGTYSGSSDSSGDGTGGEARGGLSPDFKYHMANGGLSALAAGGGAYNLGGYSDGGRLLKGPGDGVSDSIPATIANKQPARLADGEFVIPARIVSELGNGSTDAGARQLYKMMDRIQAARRKTTGKNKVATNSRASKALPA